MGYVISYNPFLSIRLEDDGGAPVTAFSVTPTVTSKQQMQLNQILYRPRPDGAQLFYRSTPHSAPPLLGEINRRVRYSFHLKLTDGGFFAGHFPDFTTGDGAALHFDNLDGAGAIQPSGVISQGAMVDDSDSVEIGTIPFPARVDLTGGVPADIEVRDPISGAVLVTEPVSAPAGASEITVLLDTTGPGAGLYRAVAAIPAAFDRRIYADPAFGGPVRGAIDLYWETAQDSVPSPDGEIYRVVFQRR